MKTNFDCIGVEVSENEKDPFIGLKIENFKPIQTPWGNYRVAKDETGAEIWQGLSSDGESVTMNPTFLSGCSLFAVLDYLEPDHDYGLWEANMAMSILDGEETATRFQAMAVNMPEIIGFEEKRGLLGFKKKTPISIQSVLPRDLLEVELTVLSMEPEVFSTKEAFNKSQEDQEMACALNGFIPAGMFGEPAEPYCFGAGEVLESGNAIGLGGTGYCWAQVRFLDYALNVVWPESFAKSANRGEVIAYEGTLMAKVMNLPK